MYNLNLLDLNLLDLVCSGSYWPPSGFLLASFWVHNFHTLFIHFNTFLPAFFETLTLNNYHSEDAEDSGSRKVEHSLNSTTFLD